MKVPSRRAGDVSLLLATVFFVAITLSFANGPRNVEMKTIISGLLPKDDLCVQLIKAHPDFRNPMTVTDMVNRKYGDIACSWAYERGCKANHWVQIDEAAEVNHPLLDLVGMHRA